MAVPTSVGLVSACTVVVTTRVAPLAYRTLHAHQVLDMPNHRSSHVQPTVRGGGVACLAALLVVWLGATVSGVEMPHLSLMAAAVLAGVGLADDIWGLPSAGRLLAQVVVGVALGAALGGPGTMLLGALAFPVGVNAVNFMDGINGITGLTVSAWAIVVLVAGSGSTGPAATLLAALALGQAMGFLPWNVPRARMFLGDSGSYLFGALIAGAVLESHTSASTGSAWLVVIAPLTIYLFDTGFTLLRRAGKRAPLLAAHREHLYQRLWPSGTQQHMQVALLVAGLSLLIGLAWLLLAPVVALVGTAMVLAFYLWLSASNRATLTAGGIA
ncbi:glycosyltransferase family 4 protein [soil metagenome]